MLLHPRKNLPPTALHIGERIFLLATDPVTARSAWFLSACIINFCAHGMMTVSVVGEPERLTLDALEDADLLGSFEIDPSKPHITIPSNMM